MRTAILFGAFDTNYVNNYDLNRVNNVAVPLTFSVQMNILGNFTTTVINNTDFNAFVGDLVYESNATPKSWTQQFSAKI